MSLRSDAEEDLAIILEDLDCGGSPIVLINPAGDAEDFIGQTGDIAQVIDPDTGQAVSGRLAHISLRLTTIAAKAFDIPVGVTKSTLKPWLAIIVDHENIAYRFKVQSSHPDRTLGIVTCTLEIYDVGVVVGGLFTFQNGDSYDFQNSDIFEFN